MKFLLSSVIALFPLLHETEYPATLQSCSTEGIFLNIKDEVTEVKLFNVTMNENGYKRVCSSLKEAKDIRVEIDLTSKVEEPLSVYLFADDVFLQEEVLKNNEAYINIRNPEYTYEKVMEEAASVNDVMAKNNETDKKENHQASQGYRYLLLFFGIWVIMAWILFRDKVKRKPKSKPQPQEP